jgi:hypothetical protein
MPVNQTEPAHSNSTLLEERSANASLNASGISSSYGELKSA